MDRRVLALGLMLLAACPGSKPPNNEPTPEPPATTKPKPPPEPNAPAPTTPLDGPGPQSDDSAPK